MFSPLGRTAGILAAFLLVLPITAFTQQPKVLAPHDPIAPKMSHRSPLPAAVADSMVGGPWIVDANFKSSIYLKNVVETSPVTITPVLYLSNGTKYTLPAVQLEPSGTATIDINAALQNLGIAPYATLSGWVELQYNWPWAPLCAIIRDVDVAHSMIFTFGVQAPMAVAPSTNSSGASQVVEGMWWKQESNVTGFLTLANTTSTAVTAVVQVTDNSSSVLGTYNVTLSPQGMKTLNLQELQSPPTNEGGIRISYAGQQDALIINGDWRTLT